MSLGDLIKRERVSLTFEASSARLNFEETTEGRSNRSVSMRLALGSRKDVRLPDKRSLKNVEWSIYLFEKELSVDDQKPEGVGVLSYFEASDDDFHPTPEGCHIEAGLTPDNFQTLVTALQAGRIPDGIAARIQGLEYGWEPDGSGVVWDIKDTPRALVVSVSFGIPLILPQAHFDTDVDDEVVTTLPASSGDILQLRSTILQQTTLLAATMKKSVIAIVLVALVWLFARG